MVILQILKKIQSDELIDDEKPLVNYFNEISLKGDGDRFENGIETNECENLELECCIDDAKEEDNDNDNVGNETNRTNVIAIGKIPRRMPMDPKKKTQLLAALKSIDTKK